MNNTISMNQNVHAPNDALNDRHTESLVATISEIEKDETNLTWGLTTKEGKSYTKRSNLVSPKATDYLRQELSKLGYPHVNDLNAFDFNCLRGKQVMISAEVVDGFEKIYIIKEVQQQPSIVVHDAEAKECPAKLDWGAVKKSIESMESELKRLRMQVGL